MEIRPYEKNAKEHPKAQVELIAKSISRFGWQQPIKVGKDNVIIVGHGRYEAYKLKDKYPMKPMWVIDEAGKTISGEPETTPLSDLEEKAYRIADNQINALSKQDMDLVIPELKLLDSDLLELTGFDTDLLLEEKYKDGVKGSIAADFLIPPFSVLDTMSAPWLKRKKEWVDLGIKSELGREDSLIGESLTKLGKDMFDSSTSVFDPVLCELMYKWFNVNNGSILDTFAGGSVRGVVASISGFSYTGIDLSDRQIKENKKQAEELCRELLPNYISGDSNERLQYIEDKYDLIFSCPPYVDLEVYSEKKEDLSNMEFNDFLCAYKSIIKQACEKLKEDRFAIFVVSEVRGKNGEFYNFVGETVNAFLDAGLCYYNEIILKNSVGTLPLRIRKAFTNRKIGRMHQNILVFYKGNLKNIKNNYSEINFDSLQAKGFFETQQDNPYSIRLS